MPGLAHAGVAKFFMEMTDPAFASYRGDWDFLIPHGLSNSCESSTKINPVCLVDMIDQLFIPAFSGVSQGCLPPCLPFLYLLKVKSALVSPVTDTGLDWFFAPSCQAITV